MVTSSRSLVTIVTIIMLYVIKDFFGVYILYLREIAFCINFPSPRKTTRLS